MEYCRQKDIQSKIGSIIQDAKKHIIIVSPYINLDSTYTALLEMSISKKIPVTFFTEKIILMIKMTTLKILKDLKSYLV